MVHRKRMVYLLKMMIFHGELLNNQRALYITSVWGGKTLWRYKSTKSTLPLSKNRTKPFETPPICLRSASQSLKTSEISEFSCKTRITGWWYTYPSEKWWSETNLMEKSNMFQTTNQINLDLACFCVFSGDFEVVTLSTLNGDWSSSVLACCSILACCLHAYMKHLTLL